jgi:pantothenate kinase type III
VGRFSLLAAELGRWADVTARNREPGSSGSDPAILALGPEHYDEMWILAVDGGTAFTPGEIDAVNRF